MQQARLMIDGTPRFKRKYACVMVQDIRGTRRWYRLSPKLAHALWLHFQTSHHTTAYAILHGRLINIPLTRYNLHNAAGIGVGKIIKFKYRKVPVNTLCTRSQFIQPKRLNHLLDAYHYLRHDYGAYSRWQIFVDLWLWRKQINNVHK